tara:strand:+ start:303 stop:524 length:222 start_codon:yes stop_codon:yes gene_type:complete
MKKTLLVIIILFFTTNISFSKEKSCQGMKKLSKAFLACKADSIKKGTVKKAGNLKKGVKKLGSGLAKPFKKKD